MNWHLYESLKITTGKSTRATSFKTKNEALNVIKKKYKKEMGANEIVSLFNRYGLRNFKTGEYLNSEKLCKEVTNKFLIMNW